jgi:hypothetical protein
MTGRMDQAKIIESWLPAAQVFSINTKSALVDYNLQSNETVPFREVS